MANIPRIVRASSLVLAVALSSVALTGCSGSSTASGSKTLELANTQNAPSTYNPWGPGYGINVSLWWSQALYDSLVRLDAKGNPQPGLAKSWKENGAKLSLQLREDAKFTDGTAVDAAAVKANIDYAVAHPAGAECNAYLKGATTTVDSKYALTVTLPKPFPGLVQDLGQCAGFVVNPSALKNDSSLTGKPAGSGPYTLDTANTIAGQKWTFVRNPKYWDKTAFPYDKVTINQFSTTSAALNAVQSGQANLVASLTKSQVNGVGSNVKVTASSPDFFQGIWFIDTKGTVAKPLGDIRVRQAMNYAIDRKTLASSLSGNTGYAVASTPFAKFYEGYSDKLADLYPYDVTKAKQLLAAAGYAKGFSVGVVTDPGGSQLAQSFAGELSKIGIDLKITTLGSNFIAGMQSGKYPMVEAAYTLNGAQYQTIQGIVGPNGFWNPLHNSDPDVAALLDKISNASGSAQKALWGQLASTIAKKALLLTPVVSAQLKAYTPKAIASQDTPGIGVPMLYNIKPAS